MFGLDFNSESFSRMYEAERESQAAPFVVLSDVFLDRADVLDKLRTVFAGLVNMKPSIIVMMGNFSSHPFGHSRDDRVNYQKGFDALADILVAYPELRESSKFIFVPGPNDPGSANVLPRRPIPSVFYKTLKARAEKGGHNNIFFTSNPARLRFYTQEIVFFREDLLSKLRRHQVLTCTSEKKQSPHVFLAKTLLEQGHLCPMPLSARPVYWAYDHALRLYP